MCSPPRLRGPPYPRALGLPNGGPIDLPVDRDIADYSAMPNDAPRGANVNEQAWQIFQPGPDAPPHGCDASAQRRFQVSAQFVFAAFVARRRTQDRRRVALTCIESHAFLCMSSSTCIEMTRLRDKALVGP